MLRYDASVGLIGTTNAARRTIVSSSRFALTGARLDDPAEMPAVF